jgi:hypothetical protein
MIDVYSWLWLALIVGIAGALRGLTGFGAALIMAPAISLVLGAREAVTLSITLNTLMLVQLFVPATKLVLWPVVLPLAIAATIAFQLGIHLLASVDPSIARRMIGGIGIAFALLALCRVRWTHGYTLGSSITVGILTGLSLGAAGFAGPLFVIYILSGETEAYVKRATIIVFAGLAQLTALPSLFAYKLLTPQLVLVALTVMPFAIIGTSLGVRWFERASGPFFDRAVLALVVGVSAAALLL